MITDKRRTYPAACNREAGHLVTEQGYALAEAARNRGRNPHRLRRWQGEWVEQAHAALPGNGRVSLAQEERYRVREEHTRWRRERDRFTKALVCFAGESQ